MTDRDVDILRWLYRYRYLRQTHLLTVISPRSQKRFIERLGDLFHETGLIHRPAIEPGVFDARLRPMLYEIAPSGIDWLAGQNALPDRAVTFSRQSRRAFSPQLPHTMMIIDALMAVELATLRDPKQRFVPVDEILRRAPEATRQARNPLAIPVPAAKNAGRENNGQRVLIPDALYGIEYRSGSDKGYRFWALECERTSPAWRSTDRASSTALKRAAYEALIAARAYRSHWGIPNLKLNVITSASNRA
ncbi:MAG: replication-relaxation family protein [Beijerinckiaceae bacterium]